jgi:hypothetical protein
MKKNIKRLHAHMIEIFYVEYIYFLCKPFSSLVELIEIYAKLEKN